MPTDPTVKSLKRATTWSFGSICFGSLLIAVIQILRQVVNQARRNSDNRSSGAALFLLCILACLLAIFQDLVEYFNKVCIIFDDVIMVSMHLLRSLFMARTLLHLPSVHGN